MPIMEFFLPVWNIVKAERRVVQHVKYPPRDRKELKRYLRIADDFAESHYYEILCSLAKGILTWAWNQRAYGELLIL
jgi:hypothetical protein